MEGFPWGALLYVVAFGLLIALIMCSPAILGALIGSVIRLIRNIFKGKKDL